MASQTSTLPRTRGVVRIYLDSRVFGPILLLMGAPAVVGGLALLVAGSPTIPIAGAFIAILFGGLFVFAGYASMTGVRALFIDVPGNAIHLRQGDSVVSVPLDEFVVPTITPYPRRRALEWYKVQTPSFPDVVLIDDYKRPAIDRFVARLETLRAQALIRRVLGAAPSEDAGAFRASPELRHLLEQAVQNDALRSAAIVALAKDRDADIARRAKGLAAASA